MRWKANRTLTAMAHRTWRAASVRTATVRMAEIVADAAEGPVVADEIVGAAGAADVPVVAGEIAGAAARVGEDTRNFIATDLRGNEKATAEVVAFSYAPRFYGFGATTSFS
jgi:hypothetical protein